MIQYRPETPFSFAKKRDTVDRILRLSDPLMKLLRRSGRCKIPTEVLQHARMSALGLVGAAADAKRLLSEPTESQRFSPHAPRGNPQQNRLLLADCSSVCTLGGFTSDRLATADQVRKARRRLQKWMATAKPAAFDGACRTVKSLGRLRRTSKRRRKQCLPSTALVERLRSLVSDHFSNHQVQRGDGHSTEEAESLMGVLSEVLREVEPFLPSKRCAAFELRLRPLLLTLRTPPLDEIAYTFSRLSKPSAAWNHFVFCPTRETWAAAIALCLDAFWTANRQLDDGEGGVQAQSSAVVQGHAKPPSAHGTMTWKQAQTTLLERIGHGLPYTTLEQITQVCGITSVGLTRKAIRLSPDLKRWQQHAKQRNSAPRATLLNTPKLATAAAAVAKPCTNDLDDPHDTILDYLKRDASNRGQLMRLTKEDQRNKAAAFARQKYEELRRQSSHSESTEECDAVKLIALWCEQDRDDGSDHVPTLA